MTISTSSAFSSSLVIACADASSAGGMWSSVMTCVGMCASLCSSWRVAICTGSWTLRSKISLEAGECSRGELERRRPGEAATAAADGYGCRAEDIGTGCDGAGCGLSSLAAFPGEGGRIAPGCAASVEGVLLAGAAISFLSSFFFPRPKNLRFPVLGSLSPSAPSAWVVLSPSARWAEDIKGVVEPCGVTGLCCCGSGGITTDTRQATPPDDQECGPTCSLETLIGSRKPCTLVAGGGTWLEGERSNSGLAMSRSGTPATIAEESRSIEAGDLAYVR
jgi:hypothetical protein